MANHASALKRARQNEIRRLRNKAVRTKVKNVTKTVRQAVETGTEPAAQLDAAKAAIDRAAKNGVIHKRTAARKISRLARLVNTQSA